MRHLSILTLFISSICFGQLEIFPIYQSNGESNSEIARRGSNDTLTLPINENFVDLTFSNTWQENRGVYINNHFATNHPSIGVLTLDGVDGTGEPYVFSTQKSNATGIGDFITSNCIDISDVSNTDGIAFSFFWQQGTIADPNRDPLWKNGTRLRLLFKDSTETFKQVWPTDSILNTIIATGETADTFYLENVLLEDQYLHDGFQFKFEYFGTLVGNYGVFSIDNIYFNTGIANFGADTTFNIPLDYAISLAPRSFLNEYSSVPLDHFLVADETIIDDSIFTSIYSLDPSNSFISDTDSSITVRDTETNALLYSSGSDEFDNQIITPGTPFGINWAIDQSALKSAINPTINDTVKNYVTNFSINTPDSILTTDVSATNTTLSDYYAYDDGTMEAGLGVRGVGEFLQAYDILSYDTLKGFHVYFPKYGLNLENTFLVYKIYSSLEGVDGNTETVLLYEQNDVVEYSSDSISLNKFIYVALTSEQIVDAGRYYIGIKQDNENRVLLGLDYSQDRSENIYYRLFNDPWLSFKSNDGYGTVALRPVMGSDNFTTPTSIDPDTTPTARVSNPQFILPNPGNGTFTFDDYVEDITIFNTNGLEIYSGSVNGTKVDLSFLEFGLYIIRMKTDDITNSTRLLIK